MKRMQKRRMQVLRGLKQRKSIKQISLELGIPAPTVYFDLVRLSKRLRPENIKKLNALKREIRYYKITPEKASQLIETAKKVLRSQASVLPKKSRSPQKSPGQMPLHLIRNPEKAAILFQDLRSTKKTLTQIKLDRHTSLPLVSKAYTFLITKGEAIPERRHGLERNQMDKRRLTGQLTNAKIEEIIKKQEPNINSKAWQFYNYYRDLFNSAGFGAEDIAAQIRQKLPWKLETFGPARIKKPLSLQQKIDHHCSVQINLLAIDMLRLARKKAGKEQISIETPLSQKRTGSGERAFSLKDLIAGEITAEDPEIGISLIEAVSKKAGLTIQEKAAIYLRFAGFTQKQIAQEVNVNPNAISYILTSAKKKLEKSGFSPEKKASE